MKTNEIKETDIEKIFNEMRKSARISLFFRMKMFFRLRKKAKEKEMEWRTGFFPWKKALAGAVCAIFIFAGTGAFAYANPSVSNGTVLYPLKQAIEKVEEKFQRTSEEKITFHAKMMEKRIEEGEKLAERGIEDKETIEMITNEFNQSIAEVDALEEEGKREDTLRFIQKQLKKDKIEALGELEEGIPPQIFDKRREVYGQMNERIGEHFNFIEMRIQGGNNENNQPQIINPKTPPAPANRIPLPAVRQNGIPPENQPFINEQNQVNINKLPTQPAQPFNGQQQTKPISGEPLTLNYKPVNQPKDTLKKATVHTTNFPQEPK